MAIPKEKLALIVASMKPKGKDGEEEDDKKSSALDDHLDEVADLLLTAVKEDDKDGLKDALKELIRCCRSDEEDDAGAEEEEEEEGY